VPKPARCGALPNNGLPHSNKARFEMNMMLKDLPRAARHSYRALERQYGAHNYKPFDVVLTRGRGVWVWDIDGRRYLDCLSAYSAVNQGHRHPRILAALTEQASRLAITSRAFMNDQLPLAQGSAHELGRRSGGKRNQSRT
jgi:4-aminobutyrate aminotransferase-like enzyme